MNAVSALGVRMGWFIPSGAQIHPDGKALRGSARNSEACIHLLAAHCDAAGATIGQCTVGDKTNEHTASLEFLRVLPLKGASISADAMLTHADFAQVVLDEGGDYFLYVKENQKTLKTEIEAAFDGDVFPPGTHAA